MAAAAAPPAAEARSRLRRGRLAWLARAGRPAAVRAAPLLRHQTCHNEIHATLTEAELRGGFVPAPELVDALDEVLAARARQEAPVRRLRAADGRGLHGGG